MTDSTELENIYGGDWTITKLVVLKKYMNAFTGVLRDKGFNLWYCDGFAGSGEVRIKHGRFAGYTIKGSAQIALEVENRRFHRHMFVDNQQENVQALRQMIEGRAHANARAELGDGNQHIPEFIGEMTDDHRAVVFIDPFATEVSWTTVEKVADSEKCDLMLMFPVGAIRRLLRRRGEPVSGIAARLDRIFGNGQWRSLYAPPTDPILSDEFSWLESPEGFSQIVEHYRGNLADAFHTVLPLEFPLLKDRMSPGTQLFELMFAASNPRGAELAVRIAGDIMRKAKREPEDLLAEANELVLGTWDTSIISGDVDVSSQLSLFS